MKEIIQISPQVFQTVFILLIGIVTGAAILWAIDKRIKARVKMLRSLVDDADTIENITKKNNELTKQIALKDAENIRYRKNLVVAASQTAQLKKLIEENKHLRKQIQERAILEDARYGALVKFLTYNGFKLTDEQWSQITPP